MTSRPSESHRVQRPSLLSARKLALMASVGLGVAVYGFSPAPGAFDIFGAAAHAQVSQAVSNAQPASFADMRGRWMTNIAMAAASISRTRARSRFIKCLS